ncbi:FAD-dependent oxidoreductase [Nocardioides sp. TF02-7]|uniref:FAD-dependent oxidoreductase n=1 Tax=Nocardioides sp. TF02-7 TaxID=2917724 RepID=UPI001F063087|nr:FAD-dependent oxidoreductase [Nocardioides sp. TF02-7]UMG92380.1 FAD-dependent oxidoreductase [Nocardioides sp. TF02-7]
MTGQDGPASARPTILTVDDDPAVARAITRDLRTRYGREFRVVSTDSGAQALETLAELVLRGRAVALVASDQRMPGMTGIELLAEVRKRSPDTKLLLLTAYADTDVAIRAINDIGLDYYMLKPWDPPVDRLYPVVDDLLGDWQDQHPDRSTEVRVVGHRWSDATLEAKTFLARNHVPYRWLDVERDEEARLLVEAAGAGVEELPLVLLPDDRDLRAPSAVELAAALGLRTRAEQPLYDLCIVGAGAGRPGGRGLRRVGGPAGTVVVERDAPGGQAGQSASIENYLGFPRGLSGADLTHRAVAQASRFGAEMVLACEVTGLEERGPVRAVRLADGNEVEARSVLVSTGVSYRRLDARGLGSLGARGVHYGATASEASQCVGADVYVVGAANSAGQAALNLARFARKVVLLVRGPGLADTMSQYLVARIEAAENIEVRVRTQVVGAHGDDHLERLELCDTATGDVEEVATNWLFVFIGASPRTDWLEGAVVRDPNGFLVTGQEMAARRDGGRWPLTRSPYALETSVPGVFAAGDVRLDSMKRVASAVGEGAMAVYLVHRYLATV